MLKIRGDLLAKQHAKENDKEEPDHSQTLHITNTASKYRLKHGSDFKNMLEAR